MSSERQIFVPQSFVLLYKAQNSGRLEASWPWIEERHDLCEDFAQLLAQQTQQKMLELRITEADALERVDRGLNVKPSPLSLSCQELDWVSKRVRELLKNG